MSLTTPPITPPDQPSSLKFVVLPARRGWFRRKQWRWYLISRRNGRKVAIPGETFNNRKDAIGAVELIRRDAATAEIHFEPNSPTV